MIDWSAVRRRLAEEQERQRKALSCKKAQKQRVAEGISNRKAGLYGNFNLQYYPGHLAPKDEEDE